MRKTLLSLLAAGILFTAAHAQKIEGEIDISYVPTRTDDLTRFNEMKAGINLEYIHSTFFGDIVFGGDGVSYGLINNPLKGFTPTRLESNVYLGLRTNNLFFYIRHASNHPIEGQTINYITLDNKHYRINEFDAITEIGVKFKICLLGK